MYTHTHTHTHTCNPSQPRTVWHTVYTICILHAIGNGTLWCTTCNRETLVYEYDSSLITRDVTGAHKFSSFVNILYIRFAIDCTNSGWGPSLFSKRPQSECRLECHTYIPGWRRLQTHTHTMTQTYSWTHNHKIIDEVQFMYACSVIVRI